GTIAHEPVLVDVTAEVHEFVDEIHAGGYAHEQPADIRRKYEPEDDGHRQRHENEHDQRIRRKHRHAPILVIAETHLLIGEELMMVERVPLIDRAQALDVDWAMHDEFVHSPFEQVSEQESERNGQPLKPGDVVDVLDVDIERCRAHRVDEDDVEIAVVPPDDSGAVLFAKIDLPLTDHSASPWLSRSPSDISHIYHSWSPCSIRRPRLPGSLNHPGHRRVPACLARLAGKDYLTAFNDIEAVPESPGVV